MIRLGGAILVLSLYCATARGADCDLPRIVPMTANDARECMEWLRIELRQTELHAEAEQRRLASQVEGLKIAIMVLRNQVCSMSKDIAVLAKDHKTLVASEMCIK